MSAEAREKISAAVKAAARRKRAEIGDTDTSLSRELEIIKMKNQDFDPILFQPMQTLKPIDQIFSSAGGIPRATNYMIVGDPGVGKSTVTLDILSDCQAMGSRVLFISAEMTRIDLFGYVQRYPKFGEIDILFLGEYLDDNAKSVFESVLKVGYDIVLIDSFAEVQESIRCTNKLTAAATEKWIIDTMISHNLAQNERKVHTTFLAIQQVTKGGEFAGSNKLKHNTTGMMEIRFDKETGEPFIMFTKNRRGDIYKKMYFSLKQNSDVFYDVQKFELDEKAKNLEEEELEMLKGDSLSFDTLFGLDERQN